MKEKFFLIFFLFFISSVNGFTETFGNSNFQFGRDSCLLNASEKNWAINFNQAPILNLSFDNEYRCMVSTVSTNVIDIHQQNVSGQYNTNGGLTALKTFLGGDMHYGLMTKLDSPISLFDNTKISYFRAGTDSPNYLGLYDLNGKHIITLSLSSSCSVSNPQRCCDIYSAYNDSSYDTFYMSQAFSNCTGLTPLNTTNIQYLLFESTNNGQAAPTTELNLDDVSITDYFTTDTNNLPLYNFSYETNIIYLNESMLSTKFKFNLSTYDPEGDTIYYSTNQLGKTNYTQIRDFKKQDCGFFTCSWVKDYNDIKDVYRYPNNCPFNRTPLNNEMTLSYELDQTGNTDFYEVVYYMTDLCDTLPQFILRAKDFNQVAFTIYEGSVLQEKYNVFLLDNIQNTLINLTIDNINTTTSELSNNGTPILNFTVNRPYYILLNFEEINTNTFDYIISDGTTRITGTQNTSIPINGKKPYEYGIELLEGNLGINKVQEWSIVNPYDWTTVKPTEFVFYTLGLYNTKIYITDSYHKELNEYNYITTMVNVVDQQLFNGEKTQIQEDIDNLGKNEWNNYFDTLNLKTEANSFLVLLYFGLLIFFTITFYKKTNSLALPISNLLASLTCLGFSYMNNNIEALLSFLILSILSISVLILTRGNN